MKYITQCAAIFLSSFLVTTLQCYGKDNSYKTAFSIGGNFSVSVTVTNPTCAKYIGEEGYPVSNGTIIATASGGTPPYVYELDYYMIPQNTGYFSGLYERLYKLTVTDSVGNTFDTTIALHYTIPNPSVITQINQLPSSCTSFDGSLSLIGSGGTPPYSYSVDGGITFTSNNTQSNLQQGYYIFYLKDANGCLNSYTTSREPELSNYFFCDSCNFEVNGIYSTIAEGTACSNTGSIRVFASDGKYPDLYSSDGRHYLYSSDSIHFYPPNHFSTQYAPEDLDSDYQFNNLEAGVHHFYAKDSTGLVAAAAITLSKSCYIAITFIGVDASCHGSDGSLTVLVNNGTPPYQYTIDGIYYQTSNVFTGLSSGNYPVTAIDANGEVYSSVATIYDKCPVVTTIKTDDTSQQKKGTITATGSKGTKPYLFSIDGVHFGYSNVFTGLAAGGYNIFIKDANGFVDSTVIVIYNNCIQLLISTVNPTCGNANGSISAIVSNGTAPYLYSIDGIHFQTDSFFNNLAAGTYLVTVKETTGLITTQNATLTVAAPPYITVATQQASCDNTGGSIRISHSGGTAPLQYSIDGGTTLQRDSLFTNLDSAIYNVYIKDANGCTVRDTVQLAALPTPLISLGSDTTLCEGDVLLLKAPKGGGYVYHWQDNSTSNQYKVTNAGRYSVKVTNQYGCFDSASVSVQYKSLPQFSIGNDTTLCEDKTLMLNPSLTEDSYLWSDGSTAPTLNISAPGSYWLQVSDGGCAKRDSISVSYKPVPVINLGNDTTLCEGKTLLLNVTNANATYLWQDGSVQPVYTINNSGTYTVMVTENGCDTSATIKVIYLSKPIVSLARDTTLCVTRQLLLSAAYPNATYQWQDGSATPQYTVTKAGSYTVEVTNTCGTTTDSCIVSYENCSCQPGVPSAFTPNGDGRNDLFTPKFQCEVSAYELKVFSRFGQLMFASRNTGNGWDGTINGNPASPGTYVWMLFYKDSITGMPVQKNGTLVLIR